MWPKHGLDLFRKFDVLPVLSAADCRAVSCASPMKRCHVPEQYAPRRPVSELNLHERCRIEVCYCSSHLPYRVRTGTPLATSASPASFNSGAPPKTWSFVVVYAAWDNRAHLRRHASWSQDIRSSRRLATIPRIKIDRQILGQRLSGSYLQKRGNTGNEISTGRLGALKNCLCSWEDGWRCRWEGGHEAARNCLMEEAREQAEQYTLPE